MKYNLIESIANSTYDGTELLVEHKELLEHFGSDAIELFETAESYLGKVTAQISAGKNPFYKKNGDNKASPTEALFVIRALIMLLSEKSDKLRDDLGFTSENKDKKIQHIAAYLDEPEGAKLTKSLSSIGASLPDLLKYDEVFKDQEALDSTLQMLNRLKTKYGQISNSYKSSLKKKKDDLPLASNLAPAGK